MNLKELARARGTNLKRLSEECGIPASTLYAISSGETNFDNVGIGLFVKLANALMIDTDDLYRMNFDASEISEMEFDASDKDDTAVNDNRIVELSPDEKELLSCYRSVEAWERELILTHAKMVFMHARKD